MKLNLLIEKVSLADDFKWIRDSANLDEKILTASYKIYVCLQRGDDGKDANSHPATNSTEKNFCCSAWHVV
jgi:hypothetical protein